MHRLSAYEYNIRDILKLRKKFKKSDWPMIDNYARAHGMEKFNLYLNGVHYPWVKAWKEIRRSRGGVMRPGKQMTTYCFIRWILINLSLSSGDVAGGRGSS